MKNDNRIRSARGCTGGLLLVDKPTGMTSHDVVAAIRKLVRPLRVGHTGTLDPIASGLLVLCVGEATKFAGFVEARYKLYRAVALLGTETDTQDITGKVIAQAPVEGITEKDIRDAACSFVGRIEQTPPAFSALKVGGVRAYKLARRQENVQLEPRSVEVRRFDIERVLLPRVEFTVECSKGTYVRTLCNDLGALLGAGGCMESLRRLAVGRFDIADARPLTELGTRESVTEALAPVSKALSHLPAIECTIEQVRQLSHGIAVPVSDEIDFPGREGSWAQALGPDGELLAAGKISRDGKTVLFHPKRVLANNGDR